jgi:hypothetical protein
VTKEEQGMSKVLEQGVALLPAPGESQAIAGAALFAGIFLLFMGFKEYSGGSHKEMDSGIRKIGLGIVATLVGAGVAATSRMSSSTKDEHGS